MISATQPLTVNKRMLYYTALIATFVTALLASNAHQASKCASELAGVVYTPETYAYDYLKRVAADFNQGKALLFTPQADSYIRSFEKEWGVNVKVKEAFAICDVVTEQTCVTVDGTLTGETTFTFDITEPLDIGSVSLGIYFDLLNSDVPNLGSYYLTSPAGTTVNLVSNLCAGSFTGSSGDVSFNLTTSPTTYDCTADGTSLPYPIVNAPKMNTFFGDNSLGTWTATFTVPTTIDDFSGPEAILTICTPTGTTCPRNVMHALINYPGFRYDTYYGKVYLTEDIFDANGNFRQVTFSRPMAGLFVK